MNAFPRHTPFLTPPPGRAAVSLQELAMCVRGLDPGSRALLDLSLRRRLPFEAMAGFLQTDPFDLARRRARAVARIAAELDLEGPGVVATVRAALRNLPDDAWGVPLPARTPAPVQADSMADAARALMVRLREQRQRAREEAAVARAEQATVELETLGDELAALEAGLGDGPSVSAEPASVSAELAELEASVGDAATITATEDDDADADAIVRPDAEEQPTVESDAIVLPDAEEQPTVESAAIVLPDTEDQPTVESAALPPEAWTPTREAPVAASPMAAAFANHPAFAVELDPPASAAYVDDAVALAPITEALARAAASERAAAEAAAVAAQPQSTPSPASEPIRPATQITATHAAQRGPGRRLARGGLLIGLFLAIARFLLGRR